MTAAELTAALGGRWSGSSGEARCPAHDDHAVHGRPICIAMTEVVP